MELIGMYMHLKTTYLPTEVPTVMTNHVLSDNQLNKVNVSIEIAILLPKVQKYQDTIVQSTSSLQLPC